MEPDNVLRINSQPLVSVVTVVYNGVQSLEQTILSVINQTYNNIEYIIIDGGSTDGTIEIIKKYEKRIAYWISEPDKGIYDAMNKGINSASGEWINFMNSGDWFYEPSTIEKVFKGRNLGNYEVVYGNTEKRKASENQIYVPGDAGNFWKRLMVHQSIFSRTELNRRYKFDTGYKVSGDFDFIYKIFFYKHNVLHLDIVISSFDMVGYSHYNRYIGFSEDRQIALKYKGNWKLGYTVYMHYVYITLIGRTIDVLKKYLPAVYRNLKKLKTASIFL